VNIQIFDTEETLNEAAAVIISGTVQTNPKAVLGLATGSTPIGIYKHLISIYQKGIVSFRHAMTFNLDEYAGLPPGHPESYYTFMRTYFFDHIDIVPGNIHIPKGNAPDLDAECVRYDKLMEAAGSFDLQLLGLGHNGHIGFNEPAHALIQQSHVVALREETRRANARFFASMDEVPKQAVTIGIGSILKAKVVLLVAKGEDKADIVRRALRGPITTDCPASLLQTHPRLVVMLDRAAGRFME
jgi:glucosamine-6-phosphate deaminase